MSVVRAGLIGARWRRLSNAAALWRLPRSATVVPWTRDGARREIVSIAVSGQTEVR
jgi:hypothetical protein